MRYTEDLGSGLAAAPFAGLTVTAAAGLADLLIVAGTALAQAAGKLAVGVRKAAGALRGSGDNPPHVALLQVPGEFITGTWRRV